MQLAPLGPLQLCPAASAQPCLSPALPQHSPAAPPPKQQAGCAPSLPPQNQRVLASQLPLSWLLMYPDALHDVMIQERDSLLPIMYQFFAHGGSEAGQGSADTE